MNAASTTIAMAHGITWTQTTVTRVAYRRGFDTIEIALTKTVCDNPEDLHPDFPAELTAYYEVTGVGYRSTGTGRAVGDTDTRMYRDADRARAWANGWCKKLADTGWTRIA